LFNDHFKIDEYIVIYSNEVEYLPVAVFGEREQELNYRECEKLKSAL
jgi:hypothetical protein